MQKMSSFRPPSVVQVTDGADEGKSQASSAVNVERPARRSADSRVVSVTNSPSNLLIRVVSNPVPVHSTNSARGGYADTAKEASHSPCDEWADAVGASASLARAKSLRVVLGSPTTKMTESLSYEDLTRGDNSLISRIDSGRKTERSNEGSDSSGDVEAPTVHVVDDSEAMHDVHDDPEHVISADAIAKFKSRLRTSVAIEHLVGSSD